MLGLWKEKELSKRQCRDRAQPVNLGYTGMKRWLCDTDTWSALGQGENIQEKQPTNSLIFELETEHN